MKKKKKKTNRIRFTDLENKLNDCQREGPREGIVRSLGWTCTHYSI